MPVTEKPVVRYCQRPGCPNHLTRRQQKYCSHSCRATAAHMKKRAEERALAESIALESIREKIEPVAAELLTDNVLANLKSLVELIPAAVAELAFELGRNEDGDPNVEDADLRHKAAVQLLKYTVSNSSIAPPSLEHQPQPLQVIIGTDMQSRVELVEGDQHVQIGGETIEMRECQECHVSKPLNEFVGQSHRCQVCQQRLIDETADRFGADLVRSVHASSE